MSFVPKTPHYPTQGIQDAHHYIVIQQEEDLDALWEQCLRLGGITRTLEFVMHIASEVLAREGAAPIRVVFEHQGGWIGFRVLSQAFADNALAHRTRLRGFVLFVVRGDTTLLRSIIQADEVEAQFCALLRDDEPKLSDHKGLCHSCHTCPKKPPSNPAREEIEDDLSTLLCSIKPHAHAPSQRHAERAALLLRRWCTNVDMDQLPSPMTLALRELALALNSAHFLSPAIGARFLLSLLPLVESLQAYSEHQETAHTPFCAERIAEISLRALGRLERESIPW